MLIKPRIKNLDFSNTLDSFFENNFLNFQENFSTNINSLPYANISENEKNYLVSLAAPGLEKKDFNIEIKKDILVVSVEKKSKNEDIKKEEYNYTYFKRSFYLPENMYNVNKIEAKYEKGELSISIPKLKKENKESIKKIDVL